jgi:hypothetical protein
MFKTIKHKGVKIALWVLAISVFLLVLSAIAARIVFNLALSFDTVDFIYSIFYITGFVSIYTTAISIVYLLFVFIKKIIRKK